MRRAFDRALWLIAAWRVWRPRLYLASRALLGVPGEVILHGQWTGDGLELRGPVTVRVKNSGVVGSIKVRP